MWEEQVTDEIFEVYKATEFTPEIVYIITFAELPQDDNMPIKTLVRPLIGALFHLALKWCHGIAPATQVSIASRFVNDPGLLKLACALRRDLFHILMYSPHQASKNLTYFFGYLRSWSDNICGPIDKAYLDILESGIGLPGFH